MPRELAAGIAQWLRSRQSAESGRVVDSAHQVPGTYADGFAALTFSLLGWDEPRDRALEVSLRRPADSEFDSLAQALMLRLCSEQLSSAQTAALATQPLYQEKAVVSNNWALFRALTRSLRQKAADFSLVGKQLPSGLFPDSPFGQATPVCYHAKICATLALHAQLTGEKSYLERLRRGLSALLALVSPQGVLVPYGRSRNTLFAYGSAYLALRLGSYLFEDGQLAWACEAVLAHMARFRASDGHIPAALNDQEWLRHDWDIYINNPDYNAYAAACLLLAERLAPVVPAGQVPPVSVLDLGPLLVARQAQGYFACSTTGEFAPHGSPFFCDTRYAGLSPLLFDDGTQWRVFDENYCWDGRESTRRCLFDPCISNWIPYLELDQGRYWVRHYEAVRWSLEDGVLRVCGSGKPGRSSPTPRWRRFVASRLLRQPAPQLSHHQLEQPLDTTLEFDFNSRQVRCQSTFPTSQPILRRESLQESLCPTSP